MAHSTSILQDPRSAEAVDSKILYISTSELIQKTEDGLDGKEN